jgi:hypothetical protein
MALTRRRTFFLLTLLLLLALALLAFLALDTDDADAPAGEPDFSGCDPDEAATEAALAAIPTPTPLGPDLSIDELNRPEQAGPFVGKLCDFEIVATEDEAKSTEVCRGEISFISTHDSANPRFVDSELNSTGLSEQVLCDGTPIAVYGESGRSVYFLGAARVYAGDTPRERLRVAEVDGHPVLIILPPQNPATYFFHAIERLANGTNPGILLAGGNATTYEETIEKARAALLD